MESYFPWWMIFDFYLLNEPEASLLPQAQKPSALNRENLIRQMQFRWVNRKNKFCKIGYESQS